MKPKVDCHSSYAVSGAPTAPCHCVHMDVSHLSSHLTCRTGIAMGRAGRKKKKKNESFFFLETNKLPALLVKTSKPSLQTIFNNIQKYFPVEDRHNAN